MNKKKVDWKISKQWSLFLEKVKSENVKKDATLSNESEFSLNELDHEVLEMNDSGQWHVWEKDDHLVGAPMSLESS